MFSSRNSNELFKFVTGPIIQKVWLFQEEEESRFFSIRKNTKTEMSTLYSRIGRW